MVRLPYTPVVRVEPQNGIPPPNLVEQLEIKGHHAISDLLVQGVVDYAIYMLNPEGYVMSWNAGAERIKGYTADEIVGQHFSCFYAPEDVERGAPAQALETALQEGHYTADAWRCRKDGNRFWASIVIAPIRENGKLIGFAKVTRDLTEQQAFAAAALKSERATSHLREQFIAILGHDLRNPLAAILAGTGLLKRMPLTDRAAAVLLRMEASGRRMSELIDSVLDFARARLGGGVPLNLVTNQSIEPTLRQIIAELSIIAPDRTFEAGFHLTRLVDCDLDRIGQLFSNLLGNAITHGTDAKSIRVLASSERNVFQLSVANVGEPTLWLALQTPHHDSFDLGRQQRVRRQRRRRIRKDFTK